ncbi:inner centromere protein [Skeletonema marinoi]|uniref:Inner centromere protein n=1 Tax=Skeletonema marinoi TaxID=267567 RepID=A0AAD8XYQ5_9STRA|nr:inner centromere protein [Skeletonema marinoi]
MTTRRFRTSSSASIAGADRSITNLFASISNEECRHDVTKLYEGRLRSHARNFEGMKRKWEGFTGVPLPKKLKTSSDAADASASASSAPAVASSVVPPAAALPCAETDEANNESIGKGNSNNAKVDNVEHDTTKTAIDDSAALKKPEVLAATNTKKATAPSTNEVDTRPTAAQSKQTTAASQQPPPPLPHHPHDDIDVDNLKWNDLRKIVKQHGLSTAGRKFELQERLRSHLEEERRVRLVEWNEVHGGGVVEEVVEEEVCDEVMEEEKKVEENEEVVETEVTKEEEEVVKPAEEVEEEKADDDVVAMEEDIEEEKPAKSIEASSSSGGGGGKVMSMVRQLSAKNEQIVGGGEAMMPATTSRTYETARKVTEEEDSSKLYNAVVPPPPPSSMKKEPPKSALKPSKYATAASSAAIHSTPVDRAAGKNLLASLKKDPPAFATNDKKIMSSSKLEPNSLQKTKLISSIIEETVPSGTSSAFKSAKVESAKLQEKKKNMAAASEARKARLAEMREKGLKSATKTTNSAHPKYATASSTLKKMAAHSSASKPNNVKSTSSSILRAKMNEKVAMAEKSAATSAATASSSIAKPEPMPAVPSASSNTSSISKFQHSTSVPPSQLKSKKALKSILDPANTSPAKKAAAVSKPKVEEKPLSPMQTYDMSDREEESDESDSDDEYETQRPKKKVPEWAQRHNLHRALERQFADGPNRLDPDKIFGEVLTCNLEEIFDKKKSRYQRRTSSGNWTKDHVTIAEKLTYKRTMGYQK